jgi:hypothetical protein
MKIIPASRGARIRLLLLLFAFALLGFIYRDQNYFIYSRAPVLFYYFRYTPHEGDIIFQSLPRGDLVDAIEGITHSPYSHCGVVIRNEKNQWVVIESIFNVHETPLFLWEFRGRGGAFTAYRLDFKYEALVPEFKRALIAFLGRPYDYNYDMTNDRAAYCSSLAYIAFQKATGEQMGQLEKLRDLDWKPYETFIKQEQDGGLPLDRVMITPASLARAPQLHEVYRSGF